VRRSLVCEAVTSRRRPGATAAAPWRADPTDDRYVDVRAGVVAAAARCVARDGLARTTVEAVATEAGCSRATVYRYFAGRDELLVAVLGRSADALAAHVRARVARCDDVEDVIVDGLLAASDAIARSPDLTAFSAPDVVGLTTRLAATAGVTSELVAAALAPLLDALEASGRMRPDITRQDAAEWLLRIGLSLLSVPIVERRSRDELRSLLRRMLLPSLLAADTAGSRNRTARRRRNN
jgi:AcrR family transcriptional regulator